jgi:molecular chaperone GrpE
MSEQNREPVEPESAATPERDAEDASNNGEGEAAPASEEAAELDEPDPAALIAELEAERDELKKRVMYALAETENLRKRAERDRRDAEAYGGTRLARDLLSVHDNLDRAVAAIDDALRESASAVMEGVELTQRELLAAFAKHKIEKVAPVAGDVFDPNFHQAMFEAPVPGAPDNSIIEVMQPGFTIAGRLLRPALVGVAKGGGAAPAASEDTPSPEGDG